MSLIYCRILNDLERKKSTLLLRIRGKYSIYVGKSFDNIVYSQLYVFKFNIEKQNVNLL